MVPLAHHCRNNVDLVFIDKKAAIHFLAGHIEIVRSGFVICIALGSFLWFYQTIQCISGAGLFFISWIFYSVVRAFTAAKKNELDRIVSWLISHRRDLYHFSFRSEI